MGAGAAIAGGLGAIGGISQMISGAKERDSARRALENYQRQQLENVQKDRTVSRLGSDLQTEAQSRLAATQIDALRGGGTRALVGGLGRVESGNQNVNQQIAANLDQQQKDIDAAIAQDNANIRGMQENRENADISALSSQYQSGKQDYNTGFGNMLGGVGMLGNSLSAMGGVQDSAMPQQETNIDSTSGFSTSGVATGPNTPMSPASMQFASGYATPPILTNPSYNPQNYGPQNAYGVFNQRYPYGNVYGPQNR